MIVDLLYHGSPVRGLAVLLPRSVTGQPPTDGREAGGEWAYMTDSLGVARQYAGRSGQVYRCLPIGEVRPLEEIRAVKGCAARKRAAKLAAGRGCHIFACRMARLEEKK